MDSELSRWLFICPECRASYTEAEMRKMDQKECCTEEFLVRLND